MQETTRISYSHSAFVSNLYMYIRSQSPLKNHLLSLREHNIIKRSTMAENMKWRKIQIDFVTNLPEQCGYKHCLTVVDLHTRWIELMPLKKNSACEAAYNVFTLNCHFGCPEIILSNRGMYITSNNLIYYYVYYCGKSQLKQH